MIVLRVSGVFSRYHLFDMVIGKTLRTKETPHTHRFLGQLTRGVTWYTLVTRIYAIYRQGGHA